MDLRSQAHKLGTASLVQYLYQLETGDLTVYFIWNIEQSRVGILSL